MERISRALELARTQREGLSNLNADRAIDSVVDATVAHVAANQAQSQPTNQVASEGQPQFADTVLFQVPVVSLDAQQRDNERILPPGSGGAMGGPYKMLRTQVLKRLDQLGANTLAVVGAASGAGKTLTAINLAIAIAADSGRTALLVDFDLRNPSIHHRFGFEPKVGVEECLSSRRSVHEAMVKIAGYDRLTVVPARERVDNSSELLRSQRAIDLMIEMRTRYTNRVLIFDLPPVLQADDALAFSRFVQAGLVVVGEGRTKREDVTRTIELLHELPIVGTVLNGSRDRTRMHY